MGKMGISSVEKKPDYRVIEITRMGTYEALKDIDVPEGKLLIVGIDDTDPVKIQIGEYTGDPSEIIVGIIKESVKAGEKAAVIKRGKIVKEAIDMSNMSREAYKIYELLEHQGLFIETLSERQNF